MCSFFICKSFGGGRENLSDLKLHSLFIAQFILHWSRIPKNHCQEIQP